MATSDKPDPQIIVDDDWKARVEKEKAEQTAQATPNGSEDSMDFPPASIEILITPYMMQAMEAMGLLVDSTGKRSTANLGLARHIIDLLALVQEKTRGNLTSDEARLLEEGLHQLRMWFLTPEVQNHGQSAAPAPKSKIELP